MSKWQPRVADQLWLDGFEEALIPPPRHNLFFALKLDALTAGLVLALWSELRQSHGLKRLPQPAGQLHLTLFPVAGLDEPPAPCLVETAKQAAAGIAAEPFTLELDRVVSFRRRSPRKPLVLTPRQGSAPFTALQRRISLNLGAAGLYARPYGFGTPHVTMAYDDDIEEALDVAPISLVAREFAFIHSHVGRGRHDTLGRWPLRG